MLYTYQLQENRITDELGREHIVYGIRAVDTAGQVLRSIPDVFFDRDKAEHFVKVCNQNELELIHLVDVVEDAIQEQWML